MVTSLESERNRAEGQLEILRRHRFELEQWFADQISVSKAEVNGVLGVEMTAAVLRAREQIESAVNELESAALDRATSDFGSEWKALQTRAKLLDTEVSRTLSALQSENRRSQAQIETVHQEREVLAAWVKERATEFHKEVSDALMQSDRQIKTRSRTAADAFERPVQELCQRALRTFEEHTSQKAKELRREVDEAQGSLAKTQEAIRDSLNASLTEQLAKSLTSFHHDVEKLKQQISEELRTTVGTNLISVGNGFMKPPRPEPSSPKHED